MTHPFLRGLRPTLHIAHRGGAALAPENTMVAFRQAVERYRTQMLELDVHLTRDGEVVVAHDPTLDRCTDGEGPLDALTWPELSRVDAGFRFSPDGGKTFPFRGQQVRIPRLVELLRAFPQMRLNIELKAGGGPLEEAFAGLLRAEGAVDRVCCGSESDETAARLVKALPEGCHFYPREAGTALVMAAMSDEPAPNDERFHVLDMPWELDGTPLYTAALQRETRRLGKWVNVWTVDDPAAMRTLVHDGVGGIMTDRPDLLREILDAP